MSEYMPEDQPEPKGQPKGKKNLDRPLEPQEREMLYRLLSAVEDMPPKFKSWLIDHEAVNGSQIPASRIVGLPDPTP